MITLNNNQIQDLFNKKAILENGINEILTITLNAIMHAERHAFLSTEEGERSGENRANGYRPIRVNGYGRMLSLAIPRDRLGLFQPLLTMMLKEEEEETKNLVFELYREGLTTRRIAKVLSKLFQRKYEKSVISTMTQSFKDTMQAWRNKQLEKEYLLLSLDAIHTKVRRETVQGEAFYVAIGLKKDFTREVVGLYSKPTESAAGWKECLEDMQKRGLQNVDLIIADGLTGLEDKVLEVFPSVRFQKCVVHLKRNILNQIRPGDKGAITNDLEHLFDVHDNRYTKEEAYDRAEKICCNWGKKYPAIKQRLGRKNLRPYLTCLDYNFHIRRMIYTTNWVERLNGEFRRALKIRRAMPSCESVLLLLSAVACQVEQEVYNRPLSLFKKEPRFLGEVLFSEEE